MGEHAIQAGPSRSVRLAVMLFGVAVYAIFGVTTLVAIAFTSRIIQPTVAGSTAAGLMVDFGFVALFGVQHSLMARARFKKWWSAFVPAPLQRSVYVLFASVILLLLFTQWRAIDQTLWDVNGVWRTVVWTLFVIGWVTVIYSTFLIDHFDLVGLRQTWNFFRKQSADDIDFRTPSLYRIVRHPMMVGFILLFWSNPTMTLDMVILAVGITCYIVVGVYLEERDLLRWYGNQYRAYRQRTPMLLPIPFSFLRRK